MNEIASRYGNGLYSLAYEVNEINEWQKEVKSIYRLLKENPKFISIISSAFLSLEDKEKMLEDTFKGFNVEIINLMKLMCKNHRERYIVDALQAFNSQCNSYRGVKEGLIYSTYHLDETLLNKISHAISEKEKMEVELYNVIDPTLIGGFKVVIDGHIYDQSIKSSLANMKVNLTK